MIDPNKHFDPFNDYEVDGYFPIPVSIPLITIGAIGITSGRAKLTKDILQQACLPNRLKGEKEGPPWLSPKPPTMHGSNVETFCYLLFRPHKLLVGRITMQGQKLGIQIVPTKI